jgi:hypothetical protein
MIDSIIDLIEQKREEHKSIKVIRVDEDTYKQIINSKNVHSIDIDEVTKHDDVICTYHGKEIILDESIDEPEAEITEEWKF